MCPLWFLEYPSSTLWVLNQIQMGCRQSWPGIAVLQWLRSLDPSWSILIPDFHPCHFFLAMPIYPFIPLYPITVLLWSFFWVNFHWTSTFSPSIPTKHPYIWYIFWSSSNLAGSLAPSGLFEAWIDETCWRSMDGTWLFSNHEIWSNRKVEEMKSTWHPDNMLQIYCTRSSKYTWLIC